MGVYESRSVYVAGYGMMHDVVQVRSSAYYYVVSRLHMVQ
jgi:hypothetical protein